MLRQPPSGFLFQRSDLLLRPRRVLATSLGLTYRALARACCAGSLRFGWSRDGSCGVRIDSSLWHRLLGRLVPDIGLYVIHTLPRASSTDADDGPRGVN